MQNNFNEVMKIIENGHKKISFNGGRYQTVKWIGVENNDDDLFVYSIYPFGA